MKHDTLKSQDQGSTYVLIHCLLVYQRLQQVCYGSQDKRLHLFICDFELCIWWYVNACVLWVCVRFVHCCLPHASIRSERLTAESQGLRRQEIKHEMKTSSSLNILPSHFPISPLPLADLKGRRKASGEGM